MVGPAHCCHAKPIHGACIYIQYRYACTAILVKNSTIVLHNHALVWQDLSHAKGILEVNKVRGRITCLTIF